jgi:PAS domain S-box-containing protein
MSEQQAAAEGAEETVGRDINKIVAIAGVILALAVIIGIWFVIDFVDSERERDLQAWETRHSIVADGRAAAVNDWISEQFQTMRDLADNASLQLYMTEIALVRAGESDLDVDEAEAAYLRNLLIATATSSGFVAPDTGPTVDANVERLGLAGLALTDPQGNILVSTPDMPPSTPKLNVAIAQAAAGEAAVADLYLAAGDHPTMGFAVPVYAVQEDAGASKAVGLVVGLKVVGDNLYRRLVQPGETLATAESYLVRAEGESVEYLSPLADGTAPLKLTLPFDPAQRAAAFVIDKPGGFAEDRVNYKNQEVLVTGRKIAGVPWSLVRTVGRAEALSEIESRATTMLFVFIALIIIITVALIAVWRHGTSLRAAQAAERYRISSERFENLTKFMRVVTDGQPTSIVAVDGDGHYTFANKAAADEAGMIGDDMLGKTMTSVIGPVKAKMFQGINRGVLSEFERTSIVHYFQEDDGLHVVRSDHIPLREDRDHPPGVLMVLDDITELTQERERRERALKQLVETLVGVVDRRDPYSAYHSVRVAEVARAIAQEMALEKVDADTVDIVGNLLNLGKIVIPPELLTKTADLTDEERQILHDSVLTSADMIEGVEFDGPVVEILRHMQERWDGSGPQGVAGEDIQLGARIVAVANAFVGMVSARAYRAAMPIEDACNTLMEQAGTVFDRRPVSALTNYVDNRGGREQWASFGEPPEVEGA